MSGGKGRASIFDAPDLDLGGFAPKTAKSPPPPKAEIRALAEAERFVSRQPARHGRRRRSARTLQLNVKTTQETLDAFYAVAEAENWLVAEAFEHAVAALVAERRGRGGG
ncbi:MAG: hypothetical protein KDG89_11595 [Geminicoccaceae bacterium]|nr:hypothetical protein [Geminicoccaceae bacterium]